ncbi:uncharacterized protein LOC132272674 [Cornus florida]|uniref:uncharacterized protein LOC132272674 n=1 Tax=Cornus florida TaxID=4283 RepID=UPI00289D0EF7|nr:uncharacterized protein LOC132272674 [Cornus florida]
MDQCVHGDLPTKVALKKRGLSLDDGCSCCNEEPESVEHHILPISNFAEWWVSVCKKGEDAACLVAFYAWAIWKARNSFVFDKVMLCLNKVSKMVTAAFWEFKDANSDILDQHFSSSARNVSNCCSWNPPPVGALKCNIDAAFRKNRCLAGGGVVFRDHNGVLKEVVILKHFKACSALMAEAFVLRAAILWAMRFHFRNLLFESDSAILCATVLGTQPCPVEIDTIMYDIQTALKGLILLMFVEKQMF